MRTAAHVFALFAALSGIALAGCGGSGGGAEVTAGVGTITITNFSPSSIPGGVPTPFTITGVNFQTTTGTTAQVILHALGGATPFLGGTSDTATVVGSVTSDTTITGTTPAATVCGVASISFEVTVILESGVKSNTFGSGGGLTFTAPTVTSVTPSSIPAEIPTVVTINGTGFGPVGGAVFVRFVADANIPLFGDTSLLETIVVGTVSSPIAISVTPPLAAVCGAASRTAGIQVTLSNGSCSALGAALLTYTAPVIFNTNIPSTSWAQNQPFTITGTGFGTTGSQVTLRFSNAGNLPLYEDGTKTASTTITGIYPRVTHCVRSFFSAGGTPPSITSVVRGIFPAGSCADSPANFVTHRLPQITAITSPAGGLIPATNPTEVTI